MKIVIDCFHISKDMRGMGIYLWEILVAVEELPNIQFFLLLNNEWGFCKLKQRFSDRTNIEIKKFAVPLPLYEQIVLPVFTKFVSADLLISSGNTASVIRSAKKQVLLIHDVYYLKQHPPEERANSLKRRLGEIYRKSSIKLASKNSDGILTVSDFASKDIVNELAFPAERVAVIHNGVDPSYDRGFSKLIEKSKRILMVSGSSPQKNVPRTIQALIDNPKIIQIFEGIDVVGVSGASEIGLEDNEFVSYHGHLGREQVKAFYQKSSHFILPSLYESFGIPAIEALMAGCDVYLSERGAMLGLLEGVGTFYDPLNDYSVKSTVDLIAKSPPLSEADFRSNISVASRYTWEKSIRAFKEYLDVS